MFKCMGLDTTFFSSKQRLMETSSYLISFNSGVLNTSKIIDSQIGSALVNKTICQIKINITNNSHRFSSFGQNFIEVCSNILGENSVNAERK